MPFAALHQLPAPWAHESHTYTDCAWASRKSACVSKRHGRAQVMEVFQEMVFKGCERSVITYSSLISACEKAGQSDLAMELFQEMAQEGCVPNTVTYNSLITACAQGRPPPLSRLPRKPLPAMALPASYRHSAKRAARHPTTPACGLGSATYSGSGSLLTLL